MSKEYKSLLLEEVRSHRSPLKSVETTVTKIGGTRILERKSSSGNYFSQVLPLAPSRWFAEDYRPDLQVAVVLPGLLLGAQDVAQDQGRLRKLGVTHILNLATGVANYFPQEISYKRIDIRDHPDMNIRRHFEECFKFIDEGRRKGWVYVHCNAGISRAATITIAYLMSRKGLTYELAFKAVKDVRPIISPNYGFTQQLKTYDQELYGEP